jgi:hypothetical protein
VNALTLIRRELMTGARRSAMYRDRVLVSGAALGAAAVFALTARNAPARSGRGLFEVLSCGVFLLCLFEGIRSAADALSRERREGTLGLLFLTDLRAGDVVLGKFSAVAIGSFSLVLSILPVFAFPMLLGGVTFGDSWRMMASLLVVTLFALSTGLAVSSVAKSGLVSMGGTLLLLLLLMGVIPAGIAWGFNGSPFDFTGILWTAGPVGMWVQAREARFTLDPGSYWGAGLYALALSGALLGAAAYALSKFAHFESKQRKEGWFRRWLEPGSAQTRTWEGLTVDQAPAVWLAERTLPGRRLLWLVIWFGFAVAFSVGLWGGKESMVAAGIVYGFYGFLIKLWLGVVAPQSLNTARQSGALELLLCTPLQPNEIVSGQIDALMRYVLAPALTVCFGLPMMLILGAALVENEGALEAGAFIFGVGFVWFFIFLLDLFALAYMGLWFGFTSPRMEKAAATTIFVVLIFPWILLLLSLPVLGVLGLFAFLLWPLFCMSWAASRLEKRFRLKASG